MAKKRLFKLLLTEDQRLVVRAAINILHQHLKGEELSPSAPIMEDCRDLLKQIREQEKSERAKGRATKVTKTNKAR